MIELGGLVGLLVLLLIVLVVWFVFDYVLRTLVIDARISQILRLIVGVILALVVILRGLALLGVGVHI